MCEIYLYHRWDVGENKSIYQVQQEAPKTGVLKKMINEYFAN